MKSNNIIVLHECEQVCSNDELYSLESNRANHGNAVLMMPPLSQPQLKEIEFVVKRYLTIRNKGILIEPILIPYDINQLISVSHNYIISPSCEEYSSYEDEAFLMIDEESLKLRLRRELFKGNYNTIDFNIGPNVDWSIL